MIPLIISLISGALGGNLAGGFMKGSSMGVLGNSIAGIVGGGTVGTAAMSMMGMAAGGGMDIGSIIGSVASGGIGGGVLIAIIGVIRNMMAVPERKKVPSPERKRVPSPERKRVPSPERKKKSEKSVFISYRRTDKYEAQAVYKDLSDHGFDVFFDEYSIRSGAFEQIILKNVQERVHFVMILTPSALDRCSNPKDLVRREIKTALESKRNIVPLFFNEFDFQKKQIVDDIAMLEQYNGLRIHGGRLFDSEMKVLRENFLSIPLKDVVHPL